MRAANAEWPRVKVRGLEAGFVVVMMVAVLVGGRALVLQVAQFHGLAISVLVALAVLVVFSFRRNFEARVPQIRLQAARDAAFLAAIGAAVAFIALPARWSLGATVAALEFALLVELLTHVVPPLGRSKEL